MHVMQGCSAVRLAGQQASRLAGLLACGALQELVVASARVVEETAALRSHVT